MVVCWRPPPNLAGMVRFSEYMAVDRPTNDEIAAEWRRLCISPHTWRACSDQAGLTTGEAGGYRVETDGFPRRGYLKPATAHGDEGRHCRAAREKIASDLAFELALPVPPALLTERVARPLGCTPWVVVSLIMYPHQWSWKDVRGLAIEETPLGAAMAGALSRCSPLLALDTWLDQTDHADHPENIVWGYNPARIADSCILFLDYANSLGFNGQWNNGGWRNVQRAPWPPRLMEHLADGALKPTIAKIETLPEETVREIVNRIPDGYLPVDQKAVITEGLIGRRPLVRAALQSVLAAD